MRNPSGCCCRAKLREKGLQLQGLSSLCKGSMCGGFGGSIDDMVNPVIHDSQKRLTFCGIDLPGC